jgi:hypothetical protein
MTNDEKGEFQESDFLHFVSILICSFFCFIDNTKDHDR